MGHHYYHNQGGFGASHHGGFSRWNHHVKLFLMRSPKDFALLINNRNFKKILI
jgi:hypothetical protein